MSSGPALINRDQGVSSDRDISSSSSVPPTAASVTSKVMIETAEELNSIRDDSIKDEPRTPTLRTKPEFQSPENTYTSLPPVTPSINGTSNFKTSNIPETPLASGKHSPPLKSPASFYRQNESDDNVKPPIKLISSTLKTRLSYAYLKHQKGWANQSLDEIEKNFDEIKQAEEQAQFLLASPISKSSRPQTFSSSSSSSSATSSSKITKRNVLSPSRPGSSTRSPRPNTRRLSNDSLETDENSANFAFLQAISKRKSPRKSNHSPQTTKNLSHAPMVYASTSSSSSGSSKSQTLHTTTPPLNTRSSHAVHPEAEAIASLMSLSSPAHARTNKELPLSNLPRQKLVFDQAEEQQQQQQQESSKMIVTPVESGIDTEVDTEYEDDDLTDEEML